MIDFPSYSFIYLNLISLSFYIPTAWKSQPFQAEHPRIGRYREYIPPLPDPALIKF